MQNICLFSVKYFRNLSAIFAVSGTKTRETGQFALPNPALLQKIREYRKRRDQLCTSSSALWPLRCGNRHKHWERGPICGVETWTPIVALGRGSPYTYRFSCAAAIPKAKTS